MTRSSKDFNIVVIIPTFERAQLLKDTLDSINACKKPANFKGVYVVENGGSDTAKDIVELFNSEYFNYVNLKEIGKSVALNHVIKNYISDDDLIIFTDDDIIVNKGWIDNYDYHAKMYGRSHFYGGSFSVRYEKEPSGYIKQILPLSARGITDDEYSLRSVFHGFNWAAFRSDIESVGFFDKRFGPGSETGATGQETVLQKSLLSMGCRSVFIRNNSVQHIVPENRSNIQWICHRAVRTGIENSYFHNGKIKSDAYHLFVMTIKFVAAILRGNKYYVNKYLYSVIKISVKILNKVNRLDKVV